MNCHCLIIPCRERCFTTFISGSELTQSSMYDLFYLESKTIDFSIRDVHNLNHNNVVPHQLTASSTCVFTTVRSHDECLSIKLHVSFWQKNKSCNLPWRVAWLIGERIHTISLGFTWKYVHVSKVNEVSENMSQTKEPNMSTDSLPRLCSALFACV